MEGEGWAVGHGLFYGGWGRSGKGAGSGDWLASEAHKWVRLAETVRIEGPIQTCGQWEWRRVRVTWGFGEHSWAQCKINRLSGHKVATTGGLVSTASRGPSPLVIFK